MIIPEIDLELSIKALEVYGIEPNIIKSMLSNLHKVVKQNCNLQNVSNNEVAVCSHEYLTMEAFVKKCFKCGQLKVKYH